MKTTFHFLVVCLFLPIGLQANTAFSDAWENRTFQIQDGSLHALVATISDCPRKKKYCKGKHIYDDGKVYEGEFRYGEPHGWGTLNWPDGAIFIGEFQDGLRHGHGQHNFANNDIYAGEWREGQMHGKGVYTWADGSKYVGTYMDGLMQGKGILTLPNGESYDGEWKRGLAEGEGTYSHDDGSRYLGKHKEGKRNGSGVITWRTGDVFIGKWKHGKANKAGTFQFNNGDKLICIWEDGEMTGEATYILVNGKEIKGNLKTVEENIKEDDELKEAVGPNLGMTWYAVAMEKMNAKKYREAKENLEIAKSFVPASSDLNKLIHQQLKKIAELDKDTSM